MVHRTLFLLLLLASWPASADAHGVEHTVSREDAIVLRLRYHSGAPLAHAQVEITHPGESEPLFTGHTDAQGSVAFLPTGEGPWRCRAFSDDGHGTQFTFESPSEGRAFDLSVRPTAGRWRGIGAGVGLIALLFGALTWWSTRRSGVSAGDGARG